MGDSRNSSVTNGDINPVNLDLGEGRFGDGENDSFFSTLYDILEKGSSTCPHLRPNLSFHLFGGEEWVETHLVIMAHWCENLPLPHDLVKGEGGGLVCGVPASLGVTPASFRVFRKAIYLKRLPSRSLSLQERLEVRRLAEHFGCKMILQKCDDVEISLKNCHTLWNKWPDGSQVKEKALEMIKGNLKLFIDNNKCLEWTESLWVTILASNDMPAPPLPTEDELFFAFQRWLDKNKASIDAQKRRTLFKDLFQFCEEKLDKAGNEGSHTTLAPGSQLMLMSSEEPTPTTTSTALVDPTTQGRKGSPRNVKSVYALPNPQSSTAQEEDEVELPLPLVKTKAKECVEKSSQKSQKRKRSQSQALGRKRNPAKDSTNPQTTANVVSLPSITLKKKSVARTFQELKVILLNASPGEEVELTSGVFDGHLCIRNLPGGVRIFGAGPTTIIKATGTPWCIWYFTDAGKNCIIEKMRFVGNEEDRWTDRNGLVVDRCDGVKIRNLDFLRCPLVIDCEGAEVSNVKVESSRFGIVLRPKTVNSVVTKCKLKHVTEGLVVTGNINKISEIRCEKVRRGVQFFRQGKKNPCNGNTLTDLTFFFYNEEYKNGKGGQRAVEIDDSTNEVQNVRCQGFDDIPSRAQKFGYALFIPKQPKHSTLIPSNNVINGVSGGPVCVNGKDNDIQNVTACKYLRAIGLRHHFTNCTADEANVELAKDIVCRNCHFGPTQTLTGGGDEGKR